jgi:hypothetical protein
MQLRNTGAMGKHDAGDCARSLVAAQKQRQLEQMEFTTMNKDDANESLLILIGELLYKNQLLREAVASKGQDIERIINHLMNSATSTCSCGVANQLTFLRNTLKERDVELARGSRYCFSEVCDIVKDPIDLAAKSPSGGDQNCRKIEDANYDFRGV